MKKEKERHIFYPSFFITKYASVTGTLRIEVDDDNIANPLVSVYPLVFPSCCLSAFLVLYSSVKGVRFTPENDGSLPLCGLNGTQVCFLPCT